METARELDNFKGHLESLNGEIKKVIIGHQEVIDQIIICLLAGGHALLEGVPGIGKTLLVRTLSKSLDLRFSRIQFTPDLMPMDIIGTNLIMEDTAGKKIFQFQPGPVFANIILADEINRATPKTQSALLEAMQESGVTIAGTRYELTQPFLVLATQNPVEMEGTYPLPEAQLDRFFFKIIMSAPKLDELSTITTKTTGTETPQVKPVLTAQKVQELGTLARQVPIAAHLVNYVSRLILATHQGNEYSIPQAIKYLRYGASPRGAQAIVLASKIMALAEGRLNVSQSDIVKAALPALRHRLILNFEAEAEGITTDKIISGIIDSVPKVIEKDV
ncbi:AAA family ATPase [Planctomycetota bacterium]